MAPTISFARLPDSTAVSPLRYASMNFPKAACMRGCSKEQTGCEPTMTVTSMNSSLCHFKDTFAATLLLCSAKPSSNSLRLTSAGSVPHVVVSRLACIKQMCQQVSATQPSLAASESVRYAYMDPLASHPWSCLAQLTQEKHCPGAQRRWLSLEQDNP